MEEDQISVISIEHVPQNKNKKERCRIKEEIQGDKEISAWNMCHVFSVLTVSVVFLVPLTLIPRTNSIFYQSKWYEFNFVLMGIMLLIAANEHLNMATYFRAKSFLSFRMLFKTFSFFMVTWTIPYVITYAIWCRCLMYNWPIPFLQYLHTIKICEENVRWPR